MEPQSTEALQASLDKHIQQAQELDDALVRWCDRAADTWLGDSEDDISQDLLQKWAAWWLGLRVVADGLAVGPIRSIISEWSVSRGDDF